MRAQGNVAAGGPATSTSWAPDLATRRSTGRDVVTDLERAHQSTWPSPSPRSSSSRPARSTPSEVGAEPATSPSTDLERTDLELVVTPEPAKGATAGQRRGAARPVTSKAAVQPAAAAMTSSSSTSPPPGSPPAPTLSRLAALYVEAYQLGASIPTIARDLGGSPATVRRQLRAAGVHLPGDRSRGRVEQVAS